MKNLTILTTLFLLCSHSIHAQCLKGNEYITIDKTLIKQTNIEDENRILSSVEVANNTIFRVIETLPDDLYLIEILPFKTNGLSHKIHLQNVIRNNNFVFEYENKQIVDELTKEYEQLLEAEIKISLFKANELKSKINSLKKKEKKYFLISKNDVFKSTMAFPFNKQDIQRLCTEGEDLKS